MIDLLIPALQNAFELLQKQIPKTKKETVNENINGVLPLNISSFIKSNNISQDCWFTSDENNIFITYEIDVPITDVDVLKFCKKRFTDIAWQFVYKTLTANGYQRKGFNSGLLKEFDDTTNYDMFINKQFDRLVKYYSLYFKESV